MYVTCKTGKIRTTLPLEKYECEYVTDTVCSSLYKNPMTRDENGTW
jgi:hypothetical protein